MKTRSILMVIAMAVTAVTAIEVSASEARPRKATKAAPAPKVEVVTPADSTTLCAATLFGHMVREQFDGYTRLGITIDPEAFCRVFTSAFMGDSTGVSDSDADAYMVALFRKANEAEMARFHEAEKQFMERAAAMDNALTTPSGLVIRAITPGTGAMPAATDRVKVKYEGYLADGTMFDSSEGQDVEFGVSGLIPGFTEGLLMMKTGGQYELYIPSDLAYGAHGAGGVIPPYAPLRFVVTLDEVVTPAP